MLYETIATLSKADEEEANYAHDISVASQRKNFSLDYHTLDSDAFKQHSQEVSTSRKATAPSTMLVRKAVANQRAAAERNEKLNCRAPHVGETDTAETKKRLPAEARETVQNGAEHLYRDPAGVKKAGNYRKNSCNMLTLEDCRLGEVATIEENPKDTPDARRQHDDATKRPHIEVKTMSDRVGMTKRGMLADTAMGRRVAASRQCRFALQHIQRQFTGLYQKGKAKHDKMLAKKEKQGDREAIANIAPFKPLRFFDNDFYVGTREALYPPGTAADSTVREPSSTQRLNEVFEDTPLFLENGPFFSTEDPAAPFNQQLMLPKGASTGHVAAALSAVLYGAPPNVDGRELLLSLFVAPLEPVLPSDATPMDEDHAPPTKLQLLNEFFSLTGCVGVTLYIDGAWEWVIVDDVFAFDVDGQPTFSSMVGINTLGNLKRSATQGVEVGGQANPSLLSSRFSKTAQKEAERVYSAEAPLELWPLVLEKALAKVLDSYDSIDGGITVDTLVALTGGVMKRCSVPTPSLSSTPTGATTKAIAGRGVTFGEGPTAVVAGGRKGLNRRDGQHDARGCSAPAPYPPAPTSFDDLQDLRETSMFVCKARHSLLGTITQQFSKKRQKERQQRADGGDDLTNDPEGIKVTFSDGEGGCKSVTLYPQLPYIVSHVWRDEGTGTPMVELFSPWGPLTEEADGDTSLSNCYVTSTWEDFIKVFDCIDSCAVTKPSDHVVMAATVAPPTEELPELGREHLVQEAVPAFYFHFTAPLKAPITIVIEQADPKGQEHLPHNLRRSLPLCNLGATVSHLGALLPENGAERNWTGTERSGPLNDNATAKQLPNSVFGAKKLATHTYHSEMVYNRQVSLTLLLSPGYYLIQPTVALGPSIPFTVRVLGSSMSVMALWRVGEPSSSTGVTTWGLPKTAVEDDIERPPPQVEDRASESGTSEIVDASSTGGDAFAVAKFSTDGEDVAALCKNADLQTATTTAFAQADILKKGSLDSRGLERAAMQFLLHNTEFGAVITAKIADMKRQEEEVKRMERAQADPIQRRRSSVASMRRRSTGTSFGGESQITTSSGVVRPANVSIDNQGFGRLMVDALRSAKEASMDELPE